MKRFAILLLIILAAGTVIAGTTSQASISFRTNATDVTNATRTLAPATFWGIALAVAILVIILELIFRPKRTKRKKRKK